MFKHNLYKNKTAVILGAGKSGLACGSLLKKKGIKFCYWDENKKLFPRCFTFFRFYCIISFI